MTAAVVLFISGLADKFATFVVKCLAVGGGFLLGYLLGGLVAYALNRWLFSYKAPDVAKQAIRVVAGLIVAIIVALIVFGEGTGSGPGGPEGSGSGKSDIEPPKGEAPKPPTPKDKPPEPIKLPSVKADKVPVRVTFLGGDDVKDGRAYLLDDDRSPKTFKDLIEAIQKRRAAESAGIYLVFGRTGTDLVSRRSTDVTAVEDWAQKENLRYVWPEDESKK
ncbi:MAG TPA: hypothetical protein VKE74_07945 [Gemmataceae bacterium]|nr:hypothetical protein [Gemmataceae bacterium]